MKVLLMICMLAGIAFFANGCNREPGNSKLYHFLVHFLECNFFLMQKNTFLSKIKWFANGVIGQDGLHALGQWFKTAELGGGRASGPYIGEETDATADPRAVKWTLSIAIPTIPTVNVWMIYSMVPSLSSWRQCNYLLILIAIMIESNCHPLYQLSSKSQMKNLHARVCQTDKLIIKCLNCK